MWLCGVIPGCQDHSAGKSLTVSSPWSSLGFLWLLKSFEVFDFITLLTRSLQKSKLEGGTCLWRMECCFSMVRVALIQCTCPEYSHPLWVSYNVVTSPYRHSSVATTIIKILLILFFLLFAVKCSYSCGHNFKAMNLGTFFLIRWHYFMHLMGR